jgi:hypothetical protein
MNFASGIMSIVAPIVAETIGSIGSRVVQTIGDIACKKI